MGERKRGLKLTAVRILETVFSTIFAKLFSTKNSTAKNGNKVE